DRDGLLRRSGAAAGEILDALDTGVVDDDVEVRIAVGQLDGESPDIAGIALIQRQILDARVVFGHRFQRFEAPAPDDDLVAQPVERLGQAAANPGASPGHQDRVARHLHGALLQLCTSPILLPTYPVTVGPSRDDLIIMSVRSTNL